MEENNQQFNESQNNQQKPQGTSGFGVIIRVLMLAAVWTLLFNLLSNGFRNSEQQVTIRFDNLNTGNIFTLVSNEKHPDKLTDGNNVVANIQDNSVIFSEDYLQSLKLRGYNGPVTIIEDMITFNDGDVYYSDRVKITILETTPVEYIHNLASENKMDVISQDGSSFTVVFRKTLSLAEYKDKIVEFEQLPDILSVEKIYLSTEGKDGK